jgi:hypothetical protein
MSHVVGFRVTVREHPCCHRRVKSTAPPPKHDLSPWDVEPLLWARQHPARFVHIMYNVWHTCALPYHAHSARPRPLFPTQISTFCFLRNHTTTGPPPKHDLSPGMSSRSSGHANSQHAFFTSCTTCGIHVLCPQRPETPGVHRA